MLYNKNEVYKNDKILIVEDEPSISNLIKENLCDAGYLCHCAFDGLEAADLIDSHTFDLVLLDIMLPKSNGCELLEYIRPLGIPVIFLTAKADTADKVKRLKLGAEDYITKPFEIAELLARVETVLRRFGKTGRYLTLFDITIDTLSRTIKKGKEHVALTAKEDDLLLLFSQNRNIALYHNFIYERVWGTCTWMTAGPQTCMSRGCGKNWVWKTKLFQSTRLVTSWRNKQ